MPKDYPRSRRVAEHIQRELADIVRLEMRDPYFNLMTVTDVEVTPDLEHAKVFVTSLNPSVAHADLVKRLNQSAGFLRAQLARRMKLRMVPALAFAYDESVERGTNLSRLIDEAVAEDRSHHADDEGT